MSSFHPDHPFRSLPRSPDFEHLREEAKSLKKACAARDANALAFVRFHQHGSASEVKLADAQFAIARAYGFKSWPRLKAFVETQSHTPAARGELLLRTLFTNRFGMLEELYGRRDDLPRTDFFLAAALGDVSAIEAMLAADPTLASRVGGPLHTQAICYAAHARFALFDPTYVSRQQRIVTLLLARGADPNAFVSERNLDGTGDGRWSALYGCCRHPGNPSVAKLLLDAGATPNDGESLYHASELRDTSCLELLFSAGVEDKRREYCIVRALDSENPRAVQIYLEHGANPNHLDHALFRGLSLRVIGLLVEHGADVNRPARDTWLHKRIRGLMPVQLAERAGNDLALRYLLEKGAIDARTPQDLLIGACAREDADAVRTILDAHPHVVETFGEREHSNLSAFARAGRLRSVELMLDAGFDIDARADDLEATGLHYAASRGDVDMTKLLLARGANLNPRNKYGGTPIVSAIYCAAHFRDPNGKYGDVVAVLLDAGATVGEDELKLAVEHDLDDIADVLKSRGIAL